MFSSARILNCQRPSMAGRYMSTRSGNKKCATHSPEITDFWHVYGSHEELLMFGRSLMSHQSDARYFWTPGRDVPIDKRLCKDSTSALKGQVTHNSFGSGQSWKVASGNGSPRATLLLPIPISIAVCQKKEEIFPPSPLPQ